MLGSLCSKLPTLGECSLHLAKGMVPTSLLSSAGSSKVEQKAHAGKDHSPKPCSYGQSQTLHIAKDPEDWGEASCFQSLWPADA